MFKRSCKILLAIMLVLSAVEAFSQSVVVEYYSGMGITIFTPEKKFLQPPRLKIGDEVPVGSRIETGENCFLELKLVAQNSIIKMGENTTIAINSIYGVKGAKLNEIKIFAGQLRAYCASGSADEQFMFLGYMSTNVLFNADFGILITPAVNEKIFAVNGLVTVRNPVGNQLQIAAGQTVDMYEPMLKAEPISDTMKAQADKLAYTEGTEEIAQTTLPDKKTTETEEKVAINPDDTRKFNMKDETEIKTNELPPEPTLKNPDGSDLIAMDRSRQQRPEGATFGLDMGLGGSGCIFDPNIVGPFVNQLFLYSSRIFWNLDLYVNINNIFSIGAEGGFGAMGVTETFTYISYTAIDVLGRGFLRVGNKGFFFQVFGGYYYTLQGLMPLTGFEAGGKLNLFGFYVEGAYVFGQTLPTNFIKVGAGYTFTDIFYK
ncbi:MAG: hypothetical protein JW969_14030 [Spirochaetales bacterium]|nr:hypothetical protein [Spirochaetales bacterium]